MASRRARASAKSDRPCLPEGEGGYFVTISRKRKIRKLHYTGRCGLVPGLDVLEENCERHAEVIADIVKNTKQAKHT